MVCAWAAISLWSIDVRPELSYFDSKVKIYNDTMNMHAATPCWAGFYVSIMDSGWYACKNIGAYFSAEEPFNNIDSIGSCQPQVRYEGDFITDKEEWPRISGSFVAPPAQVLSVA